MSPTPPSDPLTLGQHLVAVLETGARVATYKLAVLVALLEFCVEHVPEDHDAEVSVDLDDLSARVIALYWRQVRDFDGHYLRQSSNKVAKIPDAVRDLASSTRSHGREIPLDIAARRDPDAYRRTVATVKLVLAQQPLFRLQRVPGRSATAAFLFDDSWLSDKASARTIQDHGNCIVLFPGVCFALARLSALLKPALLIAWVDDVRRMNSYLSETVPDLEGHLFGSDRVALQRPREVLTEAFGDRCFYCATRLGPAAHVDHVLPWSRVGIDGLTNLVLACPRCNTSKSQLLPDRAHVDRALDRGRAVLDELAARIEWPSQFDRVRTSARGLYASQPVGSPVWRAPQDIVSLRLDVSWLTSTDLLS
ncbi:HNH endonuclease [Rhodococcoides trifolii]|uniref:HNH endonuclease n=1 Tax=Rhodococcoides trifolii TaxID=908250 RepID=UPI001662BAFF|nr:HNH endonuclease signature motif containing protein [Rhodococcus trifolii]